MKAVFATTQTNDVDKLVGAWDCWSPEPSVRIIHDLYRPVDWDAQIRDIRAQNPDVIFYIGACSAAGCPRVHHLQEISKIAPFINMVCDGGDPPWHAPMEEYKRCHCFARQVNIDGNKVHPGDMTTLTPIDLRPFGGPEVERDIRLGWAGNIHSGHRVQLVEHMKGSCGLQSRPRDEAPYADYVNYLRRCKVVLNSSISGTPPNRHVKGRILEAAFAGAAVLEMAASPTHEWFPESAGILYYHNAEHATGIMQNIDDAEIAQRAEALRDYALAHYHPKMIYADMMAGIEWDREAA